ncbi:MAG: hypothetical protein ACYS99_10130 [Planctomycetota bacterium]|jgi:uncharacterized membrane protein YkoI
MRSWATPVSLALIGLLLCSCGSAVGEEKSGLNTADALAAVKIEILIDEKGQMGEIEYHISPKGVPEAVKKAMDELHPGGPYTGAEKEVNEGVLYYELTREVEGLEVEAMFLPDGTLHQEEVQVAEEKVPEAVRKTVESAVSGATVKKWEEIRGPDRKLIEYHVKIAKGAKHYKVMIATDGKLLSVYREIPAELEFKAGG